MPFSSAPATFVARFASALALTTITMTGTAYLLLKGAPGRPIQVWNNSAGAEVCRITSGGLLIGNCTTGLGGISNTGAILDAGNSRFVNVSGDTMTGSLNILNGKSLQVAASITGSILKAVNSLSSSGTLVFEGAASGSSLYLGSFLDGAGLASCSNGTTSKLLWSSATKRFSCGTDTDTSTAYTAGQGLTLTSTAFSTNATLTGSMLRFLTVSGSLLYAKTTLASSGTLVFEGAASGSSLYLGTSLKGAGLVTDCDTPGTSKLLWDATTGRFSCGTDTDTDTNTTYTAGRGLGLAGTVFTLNSTITGSLVNFTTVSGSVLKAKDSLNSSGTLVFEGAASGSSLFLGTSLKGAGLLDCDTAGTSKLLWDITTGRFSCGTDTDTDTNTTYTAGQGLTLTATSFKTNATLSGSAANFQALSGATLKASKSLASSGALTWEGVASGATLYIGGTLEGVGLTDCDTGASSKLLWDATTKRFSCGTDQTGGGGSTWDTIGDASGNGAIAMGETLQTIDWDLNAITAPASDFFTFSIQNDSATDISTQRFLTLQNKVGSVNTVETMMRILNDATSAITTGIEIISSSSGPITTALDVSDAEIVTGIALGANDTTVGGVTISSTEFSYLDGATSNLQTQLGTKIDSAGQGLTKTSTSVKLNATITGSLVRFLTVSGSSLFAKSTLSSSGTLKVLGNMSGASLNVNNLKSCTLLKSGASGDVSCENTYAGQTSITTLGTIATGTWSATVIALNKGGTNKALTAVNGGLVWSDADSMEITAAGSSGQTIISQGAAAPIWRKEKFYERHVLGGPDTQIAVGSGATFPAAFSGVLIGADLQTSGVASGATVQLWINGSRAFTTALTTDNKEASSRTAATPVVISSTVGRFNKFMDMRIDVSGVGALSTTGAILTLFYDVTSW